MRITYLHSLTNLLRYGRVKWGLFFWEMPIFLQLQRLKQIFAKLLSYTRS
jgi:hypothetical protein